MYRRSAKGKNEELASLAKDILQGSANAVKEYTATFNVIINIHFLCLDAYQIRQGNKSLKAY